jgi:hypothetical protein
MPPATCKTSGRDAGPALRKPRDSTSGLSEAAQQAEAHATGDQDAVTQGIQGAERRDQGEGAGNPAEGRFPELAEPHLVLASPRASRARRRSPRTWPAAGITRSPAVATPASVRERASWSVAKQAIRMFSYRSRHPAGRGPGANIDIQGAAAPASTCWPSSTSPTLPTASRSRRKRNWWSTAAAVSAAGMRRASSTAPRADGSSTRPAIR